MTILTVAAFPSRLSRYNDCPAGIITKLEAAILGEGTPAISRAAPQYPPRVLRSRSSKIVRICGLPASLVASATRERPNRLRIQRMSPQRALPPYSWIRPRTTSRCIGTRLPIRSCAARGQRCRTRRGPCLCPQASVVLPAVRSALFRLQGLGRRRPYQSSIPLRWRGPDALRPKLLDLRRVDARFAAFVHSASLRIGNPFELALFPVGSNSVNTPTCRGTLYLLQCSYQSAALWP